MNDFSLSSAIARLAPGRSCLIVDADEVLLQFVAGFDRYLAARSLWLDLSTFRLHGNIKRRGNNEVLPNAEVTILLDDFRSDLHDLAEVPGASACLHRLSVDMDIVVLSNVSPSQAVYRQRNLQAIGMDYPLVSNSGLKGEGVRMLTENAGKPSFFVDDIPQHHESVAKIAPDVTRIHLIGDERLRPLLPPAAFADYRADDWKQAEAFIREKMDAARH
jgi:hypothetical protein